MRCLITGFGAFDKFAVNPSEQVVTRLPDAIKASNKWLEIEHLVLPCSGKKMWRTLDAAVDGLTPKKEPLILIMTGLAAERDKLCLERFAVNIKDYRIPDNDGWQPQDSPIIEDAPAGLSPNLPLTRLEKRLDDKGYNIDISNYAGSYLCNDIYYRALSTWQKKSRSAAILFLHIPPPKLYIKKHQPKWTKEETLDHYAQAVVEIVQFSHNWLKG
ncbi:MAG: pyroglutamyl-peptidase I [Candidatus Obscuribacterales bacterium]|nr:pyroglutamyl-peptidase I [Candidatus Obscuribacterales bacterium]